jgi:DNA recombination protein RmuC
MPELLTLALATGLGLAVGILIASSLGSREKRRLNEELQTARVDLSGVRAEREANERATKSVEATFQSLASKVLLANQGQFLELAKAKLETSEKQHAGELQKRKQDIESLVKPLAEKLKELKTFTHELEGKREKAYGEIKTQIAHLCSATSQLNTQSVTLATALTGSSQARGRWGEMALRNIAELAGMTEHCDFSEQVVDDAGRRPDMVVKLPGGGAIPVDAKVPLADYLKACEETDPQRREENLRAHAAALRGFVRDLARKDYASALNGKVDYTVMFVSAEPILAAAFSKEPQLQADAMRERILIATPVTLVALLRTVGIYWRQEKVAENAEKIWQAALEFYDRVSTFQEKLSKMGKGLGMAVGAFNEAVGSFERRVLPAGRKLEDLGTVKDATRKLELPKEIEKPVREVLPG